MKAFVIILVILLVLGGGLGLFFMLSRSRSATAETIPTGKVERRALRIAVSSPGKVVLCSN